MMMMGFLFGPFSLLLVVLFFAVDDVKSDPCDFELENTLKILLNPQQSPSLQLQSLRKELVNRLQDVIKDQELDDDFVLTTMKGEDDKRNLEALARAGYMRTLPMETNENPDEEDEDQNYKRSLANLAKNGQLPLSFQGPAQQSKRGIASLARNGELLHRDTDFSPKRNLATLAKNSDFPAMHYLHAGGKSDNNKRFLGSLARSGDLGKRNIASIKAGIQKRSAGRNKRQIFEPELPVPVYQSAASAPLDYYDGDEEENLVRSLEIMSRQNNEQKRFLGSVAKSGWFRPAHSSTTRYISPEKRHIGSLARLGWLPTLRNVRRFNRSGRSTVNGCRATAADGKAEDNAIPEDTFSQIPLSYDNYDNKRFLLQPAIDKLLLRKILLQHPRTNTYVTSSNY